MIHYDDIRDLDIDALPETYAQYLQFVKLRDGFRQSLEAKCYSGPLALRKAELARQVSSMLNEQSQYEPTRTAGATRREQPPDTESPRPRSARAIQERLVGFFEGRANGDLPLDVLSALLTCMRVEPQELSGWLKKRSPPFDLWRAEWDTSHQVQSSSEQRRARAGPTPLDLSIGMKMHRLQPTAANRVISAYTRTQRHEDMAGKLKDSRPPLYTSPASGAVFVIAGHACAYFLDRDPVTLAPGDCMLYNMRHPHAFAPLGPDMRLLDITGTMSYGAPSELFIHPWTGDTEPFDARREKLVIDGVTRLTAFALSGTQMTLDKLADFTTISRARLREIGKGTLPPDLHEVIEVAHLCRLPEESLFRPYSEYLMNSVAIGPLQTRPSSPHLKRALPQTHSWYRRETGGMPLPESDMNSDRAAWQMELLGNPPTSVQGEADDLQVGVFTCRGPSDPEAAFPEDHHTEAPGEEFLYVLSGRLGVRLRVGQGRVCTGILKAGDAVWFSSLIRHSFFSPDLGGSRSLHCRFPFPASVANIA